MSSSISVQLSFFPQLLLFARLMNIVSHCSRVLLHQLSFVSPSHPSLPLVSPDYTHMLKSLILERKFPSAVILSQVYAPSSTLLYQNTFKNSLPTQAPFLTISLFPNLCMWPFSSGTALIRDTRPSNLYHQISIILHHSQFNSKDFLKSPPRSRQYSNPLITSSPWLSGRL